MHKFLVEVDKMVRPRILGLGAAAMDYVLRCDGLPREDGFAFVQEEKLVPGGSCANVLVAAANLGTPTALVAKLGDDEYGEAFKIDLEGSPVSSEYLILESGGTSLHTFITVDNKGSKAIFVHMGNSLSLSPEEVHEGMLEGVEVFFTDMLPAQAALKLARLSLERGIRVVFHAQVAPSFMDLCGISATEREEMLSLAHMIIGSGHALAEVQGKHDPVDAARALMEEYEPALGVIATMGVKGASWITGEEDKIIWTPSLRVEVVDTTGAGDAFAGGLLHAFFAAGLDQRASMEFATAVAAIKCTQSGPRLKATESDVRSFLKTAAKDMSQGGFACSTIG